MAKEPVAKNKIINRLNRIVGQVNGIKKMIDEDRDCSEIVLQVAAIRAAVSQLGLVMVHNHMEDCIKKSLKQGSTKALTESLNKVMKQMLK